MSSGNAWGRLGLAVGGAAAVAFLGPMVGLAGPMLSIGIGAGFLAGSLLGNYIFPTDSQKQSHVRPNMPKADQYPTQTSAKDIPIPMVYGTTRLAGNIIWMGPAVPYEVAHQTGTVVTDDGGGGKGGLGGGGGGGDTEPIYTYETRYRRSFLIGICEGTAYIRRCWANNKEITIDQFTDFSGNNNTGIATLTGKEYANYPNLCCAFFEDWELGNTPALPNFVFEVTSDPVTFYGALYSNASLGSIWFDPDYERVGLDGTIGSRTPARHPSGDYYAIGSVRTPSVPSAISFYDLTSNLLTDPAQCEFPVGHPYYSTTTELKDTFFTSDGAYVYGVRPDGGDLCKWRISDGVYQWSLLDLNPTIGWVRSAYVMGDGRTIAKVFKGAPTFQYYDVVVSADGIITDEILTTSYTNNNIIANQDETLAFFCADQKVYARDIDGWGGGYVLSDDLITGAGYFHRFVYLGGYLYAALWNPAGNPEKLFKLQYVSDPIGGDSLEVVGSVDPFPGISLGDLWVVDTRTFGVGGAGAGTNVKHYDLDLVEVDSYHSPDLVATGGLSYNIEKYPATLASDVTDANPSDIIKDILTQTRYGVGLNSTDLNTDTFVSAKSYCADNDLLISLAVSDEQSVPDLIEYVCSHFGGFIYESAGQICLGVFKDEAAVVSLTRDDLVSEGDGPPVRIKKRDYDQTYNRVEIAWTDRANTYDASVEPAYDNIDQRDSNTVRKKSLDLRGVHRPTLAAKMSWRYLFDSMYRFTSYSFMVGYKNMLLEVGDVIDVTDGFNLTSEKMRIMSISEDVNGRGLAIEAVEEVERLYPDIEYDAQQSERTDPDAYDPEDSTVAIRETANGNLQLSMIPSTADATGWYVYRSYDGTTYTLIGRSAVSGVTSGNANSTGTTLSNLPAYPNIVHRPDDSVVVSIGTVTDLASASDDDFFNGRKICKIGDEVIGYQTCVETATAGTWTITGLIRGMMGTTPEAHVAGETFTTMDVNFTYPLNESDMGKTIYFKVTTYHGDVVQDLSDVSATSYTVQGEGLRPLPVSLMRISGDEGATSYATDDVVVDWYYCSRLSGFGRGGFGTTLYGSFIHPVDTTTVGVVLAQTDDTQITSSSLAIDTDGTPSSLVIENADRGGFSPYKVKLTTNGIYSSLYTKELTLTKEA